MKKAFLLLLFSLYLAACQDKPAVHEQDMAEVKVADLDVQDTESDERSNWQKPEFVIASMGDLTGKTLADIGSGALGYFVFKILGQTEVERLVAVDIDPEAVKMLNILKDALSEEKASKLDIRLAKEDDPKLKKSEIDVILFVNTIPYLPDRVNYLSKLKEALKPGGRVVIVDFKTKRIPDFVGAPLYEDRVYLHVIEEELYQAGYKNITTNDTELDFQYLITAEI